MIEHLLLIFFWAGFGILHSLLATERFKSLAGKWLGPASKWYRPFYILFATISFAAIAWYQYKLTSPLLFTPGFAISIAGWFITAAGGILMVLCITKYFSQLSGFNGLFYGERDRLMQTGMHARVRHPLYLGTFLFIWGWFIAVPLLSLLISSLIITLYTLIGIKLEEKKLLRVFGDAYRQYQRKVPMIFPRL